MPRRGRLYDGGHLPKRLLPRPIVRQRHRVALDRRTDGHLVSASGNRRLHPRALAEDDAGGSSEQLVRRRLPVSSRRSDPLQRLCDDVGQRQLRVRHRQPEHQHRLDEPRQHRTVGACRRDPRQGDGGDLDLRQRSARKSGTSTNTGPLDGSNTAALGPPSNGAAFISPAISTRFARGR